MKVNQPSTRTRIHYAIVTICLLFNFWSLPATAQDVQLKTLRKKFNTYRTAASSEKIYAHLDKNVCLVGETLWFSLYLVNESTHKPGGLSKVAYVELLDAYNHPVIQAKIGLNRGHGNGQLFIPASLATGRYTFRSYTNWMKNFDAETFFHKEVTIINAFKEPDPQLKTPVLNDSIRFYPEGGNFVSGLRSRVGFKFTGSENSTDTRLAYLLNGSSDTLVTIKPDTLGMGQFYFTPVYGEAYKVVLIRHDKIANTLRLPEIMDYGFVLSVRDSTKDQVAVKIEAKLKSSEDPTVFLFIHARNMTSRASSHTLKDESLTVMVNKSDLNEGVSHITLFNSSLLPICERLYFSPVSRKLDITTAVSQQEFGIRRKVSIDITTRSEQNENIPAKFSMAVYQLDSLLEEDHASIFNYIWMNSDIPEAPTLSPDFFTNSSERKRAVMDNIMLVNGWRRFKWQSVLNEKPLLTFTPEVTGHIIKGKVINRQSADKFLVTYLSSPGLNIQLYACAAHANNDVEYEMKDFYGARKIVVQTNPQQDSLSRVSITDPFSDKFATQQYKPFAIIPNLEWTLESRSIAMQIQDIFYRDRGAQSRSESLDTTAFYGDASETYYLDDYTRFPVMEEILREYVPGVLVRKRRDGFHFFNIDMNNSKVAFAEDPLMLLDGIPVFDADKILAFDPLKVKKLEVFTRRYYKGALSFPGITSFTTYSGDLGGFQLDARCVVLDYDGLQLQREFYAPTYESAGKRESLMPDQRTLLYWAPEITTDISGRQHVEFFTSDLEGNYRISIEGISNRGQAGVGSSDFVIKNFRN